MDENAALGGCIVRDSAVAQRERALIADAAAEASRIIVRDSAVAQHECATIGDAAATRGIVRDGAVCEGDSASIGDATAAPDEVFAARRVTRDGTVDKRERAVISDATAVTSKGAGRRVARDVAVAQYERAQLEQALVGVLKPHHRFMIAELLRQIDLLDEAIGRVGQEIATRMLAFDQAQQPEGSAQQMLQPDQRQPLTWAQAIDLLCTIPGISRRAAEGILAEIGLDMSREASCEPSRLLGGHVSRQP